MWDQYGIKRDTVGYGSSMLLARYSLLLVGHKGVEKYEQGEVGNDQQNGHFPASDHVLQMIGDQIFRHH